MIGGKETGSVHFLHKQIFNRGDVLFELKLHAAEVGAVIAKKKSQPQFWH